MRTATDVGYAKVKQYVPGGVGQGKPGFRRRKHAVKKDERGRWVTVCKAIPATREYKGWADTLTCQKCRKAMGVKEESE